MPYLTKDHRALLLKFAMLYPPVSIYPFPAQASPYQATICENAAVAAAQKVGIPLSIMRAITKVETGRTRGGNFVPWAWTVNMEGEGAWFDTKSEAKAYVLKHYGRGARSFDVGCFQINYKWHGHNFSSINEMFDPQENALYAASFLKQLFAEFGDWSAAAGAYHSRTASHAAQYIAKLETVLADLTHSNGEGSQDSKPMVRQRANSFPLLQTAQVAPLMGSLVPRLSNTRGSLFPRPQSGN